MVVVGGGGGGVTLANPHVATGPLLSWGPPVPSTGTNQKWPKSGQDGCVTPAFVGVPRAGTKSKWLHNPPTTPGVPKKEGKKRGV